MLWLTPLLTLWRPVCKILNPLIIVKTFITSLISKKILKVLWKCSSFEDNTSTTVLLNILTDLRAKNKFPHINTASDIMGYSSTVILRLD